MHRRTGSIFLLIAVLAAGCYDSSLDATDTITNNRINYRNVSFDSGQSANDPFRIVGVTPNNAEWKVIIEYSGGCNEHSFFTWWEPDLFNEDPLSGGFHLSHDSNGDACEALVRDTLYLDMNRAVGSELLESGSTTIINANSREEITVDAALAALSQSKNCTLNASIQRNSCGPGIWNDKWIVLKDSIGERGKLWIIPVKNDANLNLDIPALGDYTVGLTLLFGFNTADLSTSCYVFDDALAIPAQINCLNKN